MISNRQLFIGMPALSLKTDVSYITEVLMMKLLVMKCTIHFVLHLFIHLTNIN